MSTFTSRMLLLGCMVFSLAFFSGCGPKEIEPYQQKTGINKPEAKDNSFYDYGYVTEATTPDSTSVVSSGVSIGENIDALLDNLPESQNTALQNNALLGSVVEPLDAGSGLGEVLPAFSQKQSNSYKKKNGRSSAQMKSVYYNFDQSIIRNDQISKMEVNAKYMKNNAARKVVVEGNCDERGTNEYNLALGERRAVNAKKYLVDLGVQSSRIRTLSYGEERPLFLGSEESDYDLNRRADFILE